MKIYHLRDIEKIYAPPTRGDAVSFVLRIRDVAPPKT